MADCEVEIGQWRGHTNYTCARCRIATTSEPTYLQRCEARRTPRRVLESSAGLLGPSGEPLPAPAQPLDTGTHDTPEAVSRGSSIPVEEQRTSHDQ